MATLFKKGKIAATRAGAISAELKELSEPIAAFTSDTSPVVVAHYFKRIGVLESELAGFMNEALTSFLQSNHKDADQETNNALKTEADAKIAVTALMARIAKFLKDGPEVVENPGKSLSRLPKIDHRQFDTDNAGLWFKELEFKFSALSVDQEDAKFTLLTGLLEENQALAVSEVTETCGTTKQPYSEAKVILLDRYSTPWFERITKAMDYPNDSSLKLSEQSAKVELLLKQITREDILKWHLLQRLPSEARKHLANDEGRDMSLADLRKRCDNLVSQESVSAVHSPCAPNSETDSVNLVQNNTKVNGPSKPKRWVCPYHHHHKDRATTCFGPRFCPKWKPGLKMFSLNGKDAQEKA